IRHNGAELFYSVQGEGPDLMLVHGVGARQENWERVVDLLKDRYRITRFDLRGNGRSERVPGPYTIEMLRDDALAVADEVGLKRFHLAGHSLGGLVATALALAHPERLRGVAILSAACGRTPEEKATALKRMEMIGSEEPGGHFQRSLPRWFTEEFVCDNPDIIADYAKRNRDNDPQCYAAVYRVLATTDFADELHKLKVPALVVTGEFDQGSNPRMSRLMAERIPDAELHILPKLRHSILIEAPQVIAPLLDNFFRRME
ncbi:MAG: alpha/beta fold hydrolase, partial [Pseudorhodoplanes sp.]